MTKLPINRQTLRLTIVYELPIANSETDIETRQDIIEGILNMVETEEAKRYRKAVRAMWTIERGGTANGTGARTGKSTTAATTAARTPASRKPRAAAKS